MKKRLITINNTWRTIYAVASALIGLVLLLAFFSFPETAWPRAQQSDDEDLEVSAAADSEKATSSAADVERVTAPVATKESYLSSLKIFRRSYTDEGFLKLVLRPLGLICLPPILWASLVQSVTIGFLVAVTSNVDSAFSQAYGFQSWQTGLCFIAACIGSMLGIPAGGHLGDKIADWLTRRNDGIRDPEMRLPAMIPSLITTPLGLVLYGIGIEHGLHWICPTIGLGLCKYPPSHSDSRNCIPSNQLLVNFSIVQGTSICLVYVIDAYRPVAGEVTLTVMGFKSLFGFLLSFYTNPWVTEAGYQNAYGVMAAISAAVILLWIPLFLWGKTIRHVTWHWPIISYIHWSDDREVGE
jgi:hypothetical protein